MDYKNKFKKGTWFEYANLLLRIDDLIDGYCDFRKVYTPAGNHHSNLRQSDFYKLLENGHYRIVENPPELTFAVNKGTTPTRFLTNTETAKKTNDAYYVEVPTGNCQIASIYLFCVLDHYDAQKRKDKLKVLCRNGKKILLIDVNRSYEKLVTEIWDTPESILLQHQYTSTNGSSMTLFMVKTEKLYR